MTKTLLALCKTNKYAKMFFEAVSTRIEKGQNWAIALDTELDAVRVTTETKPPKPPKPPVPVKAAKPVVAAKVATAKPKPEKKAAKPEKKAKENGPSLSVTGMSRLKVSGGGVKSVGMVIDPTT